MYKNPNQELVNIFTKIYLHAKNKGKLKECYLGLEKKYRIYDMDSTITNITDPNVILKYIIYPLYYEGYNIEIESRNIIEEFIKSNDPLEYYQAFRYLNAEKMLIKTFEIVPFVIFDKDFIAILQSRLEEMSNNLKMYHINNKINLYTAISNIINLHNIVK